MIKRQPFKCYFCQKNIENETQENHASVCSSVLEPCPNKCGSYVPRKDRHKHIQTCQNRQNRRSWTSTDGEQFDKFQSLQRNQQAQSAALRKYSESSLNLVGVDRVAVMDKALRELTAGVNRLRHDHHQHVLGQQSALQKAGMDINNISMLFNSLLESRNRMQYQLDLLGEELRNYETIKRDLESTNGKLTELKGEVGTLTLAVNTQKVAFKGEQVNVREELEVLKAGLAGVKELFVQENAVVAALWNDQKQQIERIVQENEVFEKTLMEVKEKTNNLSFEVRTANELIADCLEKIKKQSVEMQELRNDVTETKLEVELAEDSVSSLQGLISTAPGHIIWKITDFNMKLEQAKKQEKVPIKGPIFYTDDYGYRVRLMVYLNGLKKWKGRYLLACLHVIKGDYDDLLKWPCRIEANVVLRDSENYDAPNNHVRFITAKREGPNDVTEDPHESTTQYIFIAHSMLMKSNYLKNDAFYLQIIVKRQTRNSETHI